MVTSASPPTRRADYHQHAYRQDGCSVFVLDNFRARDYIDHMKRDMDLVRSIMLQIDEAPKHVKFGTLVGPGADQDTIDLYAYHVRMLTDEVGFVSGIDAKTLSGPNWLKLELTWRGHEFLDQIRDPAIWAAAKAGAKKAGGFSLELIGELAKGLIKTQIKKHTGVDLDD